MSQPMEVRVVWHPKDVENTTEQRPSLPEQIFMMLHLDPGLPASERLGMPVYFHTGMRRTDGYSLPVDVPFNEAGKTLIVAIVGNNLAGDRAWLEWLVKIRRAADRNKSVEFLGIALTDAASNNDRLFGKLNRERGQAHRLRRDRVARDRFVRIATLRTLARMLDASGKRRSRVNVFVSHAKADGAEVASALTVALRSSKADAFMDVEQIEGGQNFHHVLQDGVEGSACFVAVVSNTYATREWCRWEAQLAKQKNVPMVVLDIVTEGQRRSLPSLGNVPVVRLNDDAPGSRAAKRAYERVIEAVLMELVMFRYFPLTLNTGSKKPIPTFHAPPELLTVAVRSAELKNAKLSMYPDPPLPLGEEQFLEGYTGGARLATPLSLLMDRQGLSTTPAKPLRVAISISDVADADLSSRGLGKLHVDSVFLQICRHVLAAGHNLVYGGDPTLMGFVQRLADIERAYGFDVASADGAPRRMTNFIAHYIHRTGAVEMAELQTVMDAVPVKARKRPRNEDPAMTATLDLTEMREQMNAQTDVRIVLGGQLKAGKKPHTRRGPGVVEEAFIAATSEPRVPLLVCGGYGGAGALIADAITGDLDEGELDVIDRHYKRLLEPLQATNRPMGWRDMLDALSPAALQGNGLSKAQNAAMLRTSDSDTIVRTVVRALHKMTV